MKRERQEDEAALLKDNDDAALLEDEAAMYTFSNGLRRVKPYFFDYQLNVKGRMMGKTLLESMKSEFNASQPDYYETAIGDGRILLNGSPTTCGAILKGTHVISHRVHRHEPPVIDEKLEIIGTTESFVAVYKPASVPMHPTGRYRLNSLIEMLRVEFPEYSKVYPGHRLDRLTSGLVVLARTSEAARRFSDLIKTEDGGVDKEYVALVHGSFPEDPVIVDAPIAVYGRHGGGKCRVDAENGKPSRSEFTRLWTDEKRNVSLVKCVPKTGRTHQLRVHLNHLGHSIIDDPLYGQETLGVVLDSAGNTKEHYEEQEGDTKCNTCGEKVFEDPVLMRIYLHALRYSIKDEFDFTARLPEWAKENKD